MRKKEMGHQSLHTVIIERPLIQEELASERDRIMEYFSSTRKPPQEIDISRSAKLDWHGVAFCMALAGEIRRRGGTPVLVAGPHRSLFDELHFDRLVQLKEPTA